MKPTLQELLDAAYRIAHSSAGMNDATFRRLAAQVDTQEARRRLAELQGIPDQRCTLSATYRRFLERVLATRP